MKICLNSKVPAMQLLVVRRSTSRVASSIKNNYNYKIQTLCVLQNLVTKCTNTDANEAVEKPTTEILFFIKQKCFLVQVAGSPTNRNQLRKPNYQSGFIQKTF